MSKDRFSFDGFGEVLDNGQYRYFYYDGSGEACTLGDMYHDWFMDDEFHKQDFADYVDSCLNIDGFREITKEEYKKGVADDD